MKALSKKHTDIKQTKHRYAKQTLNKTKSTFINTQTDKSHWNKHSNGHQTEEKKLDTPN